MGVCLGTEAQVGSESKKGVKDSTVNELQDSLSLVLKEELKNSAFLFIKPHANTSNTRQLVQLVLIGHGFNIIQEGEISGSQIHRELLIDQHYYAIASKATLQKPQDMPVPAEKFEEFFGISWQQALNENIVFNALDACSYLQVDANGLYNLWTDSKKIKFGGGFYCGMISVENRPTIYVFNGFFMALRSKFIEPSASVHYYITEYSPSTMSWATFREKLIGTTDPKTASKDSIRAKILSDWQSLGLQYEPNVSDNGIHASASPFEALVERMNWLRSSAEDDPFGSRLIKAGISPDTIKSWSKDPVIKGQSLFDQLQDTNANECLRRCVELYRNI